MKPPASRETEGWTHIVVGAGAVGCVLAARIPQNAALNVLFIEAGGPGSTPSPSVPILAAVLMSGRVHIWRYATGPEPGLGARSVDLPRGRVLGGSTAINGIVYARGLPSDYDL